MAKDPEAMKAVQQLQSQMNEDVLGMDGESDAPWTMVGTMAGAPAAQAFLASAGGKLLMAKATVMGVSLATIGRYGCRFFGSGCFRFCL